MHRPGPPALHHWRARRLRTLGLLLTTTTLGLSRFGKRLADHSDIATLIGFQGFRVFVEVFLWMGYNDGFVPVQMTWEGRNLDLAARRP